jgi:hypothetical protein
MERKEGWIKAGCVKILWSVMVVVLCATPCAAIITVESGETLNVGTGYPVEQILNDGLVVKGTLNMCPGAYVAGGIKAEMASTVNIWGGTIGVGHRVLVEGYLSTTVTVYGPAFEDSDGNPITTATWTPGAVDKTLRVTDDEYENLIFSLVFHSTIPIYLDSTGTPPPDPPINKVVVYIDIKPGSDPNPINQGSNGVIPVAILTTDTFDASTVDPGTVTIAGAKVAVRGKSDKTMARLEDVDGDGDNDLLLQVDTQSDGAANWVNGPVTLEGKTYGGEDIIGTDEVIIVPPLPPEE